MLSTLVCGNVQSSHTGDLARSLRHLSETLSLLEPHLNTKERQPLDRLVAPFLVRSVIEVACTSLIARLDPFRILTLAKVQGQGDYDPSEKIASAFQWRGDVIAEKKIAQPWGTSRKANDMSRALLGDYQDEIFWQPAFLNLQDYLKQTDHTIHSLWLSNLVNVEPQGVVPFMVFHPRQL